MREHPVETYAYDASKTKIIRSIRTRDGEIRKSAAQADGSQYAQPSLDQQFDSSWLKSATAPRVRGKDRGSIGIVDLFSGCGMMTLGAVEACRALQLVGEPKLAVDSNPQAGDVYKSNFKGAWVLSDPIESLFGRAVRAKLSRTESELRKTVGDVDLLLGGPPCQGHSDLNNHTRRDDPKNALLLKMVRAAEIFKPRAIIIENVRGIKHDRSRVVDRTVDQLSALGYQVDCGTLKAEDLGVAQTRHRFFLVATTGLPVTLAKITANFRKLPRSFEWAAGDLMDYSDATVYNTPSTPSADSRRRMEYLFKNRLHNLPNSERPMCHRANSHSYNSVYGRMYWSKPSQTITTGFGSMGQGRFVHPKRRRTITPHEASRLQFVPDFFSFGEQRRGAIAEMIGNAVPPKLTYLVALEALR